MSEYEPITGELRGKMDTLGWYDEDGNIVFTTGGTPVSEIACLAINSKAFERLCDAIDAVNAGLERENAELRERVAVLDNERGNMHDGGSITGELRKWAKGSTLSSWTAEHLTAIADRIDAEHEKQCAESWMRGHDAWAAIDRSDEMAEHGWVRLPLDADGEYIRIGDVMEWVRYEDDDPTIVRNVAAVGADVFFAWSDEQGRYAQYEAHAYRHHHAPTVEDVLTEFAYGLGVPVADSYVAATAAKLRLAGDAS